MSKKATIIAVVNQKGGTGKTTTTENLGVGLALEGKKVLLVDTDPQASLTVSLGNPCPDDLSPTLSDLMGKIMMENPITQFRVDLPLDLVDGSKQLFQTLCRKVCCLNRYQHIVGSCQRIDGQHTQRRHTVKKNVIIILFDCIQVLPENGFPAHGIDQCYLHT